MDRTIKRTPDGKPEMRTPDEMLRDAVSDDADLPGKGKPLDLKAYFQPDPEHRMAGKILRDNNVLPPQLQARKDAEVHLKDAETHLRCASEKIARLREEIHPLAQILIRTFSDPEEMRRALGLSALPENFCPSSETPPASAPDLRAVVANFDQLCKRYNARVNALTYRYLENLRRARENIEASKKHINRSLLPACAPLPKVDIEARRKALQARFPRLPELPHDWQSRLKTWQRSRQPSLWRRVFRSARFTPVLTYLPDSGNFKVSKCYLSFFGS